MAIPKIEVKDDVAVAQDALIVLKRDKEVQSKRLCGPWVGRPAEIEVKDAVGLGQDPLIALHNDNAMQSKRLCGVGVVTLSKVRAKDEGNPESTGLIALWGASGTSTILVESLISFLLFLIADFVRLVKLTAWVGEAELWPARC